MRKDIPARICETVERHTHIHTHKHTHTFKIMQILLRKQRCVASAEAQEACFTDNSDTKRTFPHWRRVQCALCRTRLPLNEEQSFHYGNNVEIIEQTTPDPKLKQRQQQQQQQEQQCSKEHPEILAPCAAPDKPTTSRKMHFGQGKRRRRMEGSCKRRWWRRGGSRRRSCPAT